MDDLPDDLRRNVASFLPPADIMTCLTINQYWSNLGTSERFWWELVRRDADQSALKSIQEQGVECAKTTFLTLSYSKRLSTVKWCHVDQNVQSVTSPRNPSAREGHNMCILGDRMIMTGGFCDDERVHVMKLKPSHGEPKRWSWMTPRGRRPSFSYGTSLTPLDDRRAVRFGGFGRGGYSGESNEIYVLTLENDSCSWQRIQPQGQQPASARAYHSATLLCKRYLLIIGGMKTRGSILNEAILDTETWTWLDTTVLHHMADLKPSGRHGHSTVLDEVRNRLVVFGGGNGSDLLRSGVDNSEVWELQLGKKWTTNLEESFPWQWSIIHQDATVVTEQGREEKLSAAEALCLGRCHVGLKVSLDTVVLTCGSGQPSTNATIGYDLKSDSFTRPYIGGPLPIPRMSPAAAVLDNEGWIMIHGGWSVQGGGPIGDIRILDLAPGLKRTFNALPMTDMVEPHLPIRNEDVRFRREETHGNRLIGNLLSAPPTERPDLARRMLAQLIDTAELGGRVAVILSLVANESAVFGDEVGHNNSDSSDEEEDEDDDEDSGDEDHDEEMIT